MKDRKDTYSNDLIPLHIYGRLRFLPRKLISNIIEDVCNGVEKNLMIFDIADIPTIGKCFPIKWKTINQKRFVNTRKNPQQETTRNYIHQAFQTLNVQNDEYNDIFYLLIPKLEWVYQGKKYATVNDFFNFATLVGGYISNIFTEPLSWAQRIDNGENWEAVCNLPDTCKYSRAITLEDSITVKMVGSASCLLSHNDPASHISKYGCSDKDMFFYTVPSIILTSPQCILPYDICLN